VSLPTTIQLKENGFAWTVHTSGGAASGGHLELLKWLREEGCPWDWRVLDIASLNGYGFVADWAEENGCSWDRYGKEPEEW
jgi:hypothetical protein